MRIVLFLLVSLFVSCASQRNVASHSVASVKRDSLTLSTDSASLQRETNTQSSSSCNENKNIHRLETDFNSDGSIKRTIETIETVSVSANLDLSTYTLSNEGIVFKGKTVYSDTISYSSQASSKTKTDTRFIQGIEWLWVSLVVFIVGFIFYKKKRK